MGPEFVSFRPEDVGEETKKEADEARNRERDRKGLTLEAEQKELDSLIGELKSLEPGQIESVIKKIFDENSLKQFAFFYHQERANPDDLGRKDIEEEWEKDTSAACRYVVFNNMLKRKEYLVPLREALQSIKVNK